MSQKEDVVEMPIWQDHERRITTLENTFASMSHEMKDVKNGKVILDYVPSTYNNISNYHLLPEEYLIKEGWLPLEEIIPEHDAETQQLINPSYEVFTDKVVKHWEVAERQKSEIEILKERLQLSEDIILDLLLGGL